MSPAVVVEGTQTSPQKRRTTPRNPQKAREMQSRGREASDASGERTTAQTVAMLVGRAGHMTCGSVVARHYVSP